MLMHPLAKPLVFGLALLPLAWLVFAAATDALVPTRLKHDPRTG